METETLDIETRTLALGRWVVVAPSGEHEVPQEGVLSIGRSSSADVRLEDAHVSRRHVELAADGIDVLVRVLAKKNPPRVDGVRLLDEVRLTPSDEHHVLRVGAVDVRLEHRMA